MQLIVPIVLLDLYRDGIWTVGHADIPHTCKQVLCMLHVGSGSIYPMTAIGGSRCVQRQDVVSIVHDSKGLITATGAQREFRCWPSLCASWFSVWEHIQQSPKNHTPPQEWNIAPSTAGRGKHNTDCQGVTRWQVVGRWLPRVSSTPWQWESWPAGASGFSPCEMLIGAAKEHHSTWLRLTPLALLHFSN